MQITGISTAVGYITGQLAPELTTYRSKLTIFTRALGLGLRFHKCDEFTFTCCPKPSAGPFLGRFSQQKPRLCDQIPIKRSTSSLSIGANQLTARGGIPLATIPGCTRRRSAPSQQRPAATAGTASRDAPIPRRDSAPWRPRAAGQGAAHGARCGGQRAALPAEQRGRLFARGQEPPGAREEGGRLPGRRAGAARRYVRSRGAERALGRLPGAAPAELRGSGAAAVGRLVSTGRLRSHRLHSSERGPGEGVGPTAQSGFLC